MRGIFLLTIALSLGGCVTSEEQAQINAASDSSACQQYGAAPGTSAYFECRMLKDQSRQIIEQRQQEATEGALLTGFAILATRGQ